MTLSMVSALPILLAGLLCGLGAQAGVANTWDSLSIVEATPSPRIFPTMCPFTLRITQFYSTDLMFVFGGWDSASDVTYNDSSFYVVETSSFFIQVFTGTGPSSRLGSSSAQVSPAIALVFGGATNKATAFNDTFMYSCAGISPAGNCTVSQVEYAAGPVPDGRAFQTSVAINGMFYLFGGNLNVFDYRRVLNDCWKFDPSTRLWTEIPTPSVIEPRELHSSTTTGDYMFIYGGVGTATYDTEFVMEVLDDLWALNTVTLVWQRLQPSSAVQPGTYSASMGGLKALPPSADNITHCQFVLSGGLTSGITVDLPTTTYTVNLSMSQPDPAQLSVAPNNVSYLDTHTAGKWRLVTTISAPSSRSGAAYAVSNNIMYVFGGGLTFSSGELSNDMYALNMTEAVNDDESLWIHLNSDHIYDKPVGRMYAASHYSPVTNRIYVLQGSEVYFASNAPLDDGWFLDLNTQSWSRAESMPISARYAHTATYSSVTGLSYVYGGCYGNLTDCFTMYSDVYSFDEHTLEFTTVSVPANQLHPIQRYFHVSVMLHGTQMVVFGGLQNATYEEWKNVWVLDVISLEWSVRRPRPGQLWPASSLIPVATEVDNRMYLSGGLGGDSFDIMWIFDVMTNDWERLVTVTAADVAGRSRWGLASATLGTKILAYGGSATNQSFLADADGFFSNTFLQYDTVSNAWVTIDTDGQSEYLRGGTGYNILNGTFAMYGGATPYYATSTVLMLTPGCTIGSYSSNYRIYPCTDCEAGYYSAVSGATECTKCPGQSYTSQTGATDVSACNECQSDVCNGNGVCSLRGNVGRCSCQFGYLASDNCHLPWIVIIIVSGVVSTIVTIVILFRIRRLRRRVKRADEDKSMFEHLLGQKEAEFSDLEKTWVIPERDIERFRCVASGAFGDVYEGEYGDRPVAIKYLKIAVMESDPASLAEFEREVSFMRTLRNPNIVFFYGAGRTEEGSPFIVTEFMPMGALSDILSDENVALDDTRRRQFALDGAKGMCFLHELSPPRIHRDLKPGNLLVSAKWTVKVADFGTSRLVDRLETKKKSGEQRKEVFMENIAGTLAGVGRKMAQTVRFKVVRHDSVGGGGVVTPDGASVPADVLMSDFPTNSSGYVSIGAGGGGSGSGSATSSREGSRKGVLKQQPLSEEERRKRSLTKGVGSLLWQSPEILQGREDYDLKTDVYSYGIVLWQIVTRQVPYTDVEFHWELESRVIEGLRPPLPQATEYGSQYARLMEACWHGDPGCRPSFAQIVDTLENM